MNSNELVIRSEKAATKNASGGKSETQSGLSATMFFNISGFALVVWAFSSRAFRDAENVLTADFCLPLAVGLAFIVFGSAVGSRWKTCAGWFGLALIGQAASLQMINAGRLIHFQHYRSLGESLEKETFACGLFAVQIVVVAAAIGKHLPAIKKWLGVHFKRRRLILIAVFLFFAGAAVTTNFSIYATSLLFAAVVQAINLANIFLMARAVPDESIGRLKAKIESFLNGVETSPSSFDYFPVAAALWTVSIAACLSFFVYQSHPHVPDETQYLFQAKYMAAGRLTIEAPPVPEAFAMYLTPQNETCWFGIFPPAFPAMLAAGLKFGAVWLVNPVLAGVCILLCFSFLREIYSRRVARVTVVLLCCSPWFVFMAMSLMSHVFTLGCALGAAVALLKGLRDENKKYVFAAGLLIGVLSLTRPLDALIVAVLLGAQTILSDSARREKLFNAVLLIVGTAFTAVLNLLYNKAVTGSALLSPMDFYYAEYFGANVMSLGFGANRGFSWGLDAFPGHSPLEALINAALNVFLLNTELFGWASGSLFLAICFLFSGNLRKTDFWMIAVIAVTVGGYSLYWYHGGPDFGARYWFLTIVPLVALTARSVEWLGRKIVASQSVSDFDPRVYFAVAAVCALGVLNFFPWRAIDKYYRYLEMQPGIESLAHDYNFGKSLVLIRGAEHPDYQSAWIYNPLDFAGDAPVYAHDKNPQTRARLLKAYAERPVWIVDGPTRAGGVYKVAGGPFDARDLLTDEAHSLR